MVYVIISKKYGQMKESLNFVSRISKYETPYIRAIMLLSLLWEAFAMSSKVYARRIRERIQPHVLCEYAFEFYSIGSKYVFSLRT